MSVAEEAKVRRKRIEEEMALLSQHSKIQHSVQIEEQLARLKAEWRTACADEAEALQALKSPSLVGEPWTLARRKLPRGLLFTSYRTSNTEPRPAPLPSAPSKTF